MYTTDTAHATGHLNSETVKGVSFMGVADEFIVSGSDCGHVFIWSKQDGKLQKLVKGDRHVVNCLEPHPFLPATLATSGNMPWSLRRHDNTDNVHADPASHDLDGMHTSTTLSVLVLF